MTQATSTFGLLERFRSGDQEAFTLLFQKYRPRLAVLVYYKLSDKLRARIEVDDVLQETFYAAARDVERFTYRSPGSFLQWLARIANNVVVDAARFESRHKRRASALLRFRSDSNPQGPDPVDSRTPSRVFSQKESVEQLLAQLDALPENYRQVILLAKFEGLTTREIAERLGKPRATVALLLHRALARLRELRGKAAGT